MARRPQVPQPQREKIDALLSESGALYQAGDMDGSLRFALEAWDAIPEPKEKWDYYGQSLSSDFLRDAAEVGNVEETRKWIPVMYKMYDDPEKKSLYVLMHEGEAYFKLGLKDEAYDVFGRVHDLFGREAFPGEHMAYLEFYLKERARRDP